MKYGISYLLAGLLCLGLAFSPATFAQTDQPAPAAPAPSSVVAPLVLPVQPTVPVSDFENRVAFVVKCCMAVVGGIATVMGGIAALWATFKPQIAALRATIEEIKGRLDRQAQKTGSLQEQVNANARALPGSSTPPATSGTTSSPIVAIALLGLFLGLSACSTDTGDVKKDRNGRITNAVLSETFNAVVKVGLGAGLNALQGQNGQDVSQAVFQSVGSIDFGAAIAHVVHAASDPNVNITPVAKVAADQFLAANPQTPAEKAAVVNTIGAALQTVSNQLAAK